MDPSVRQADWKLIADQVEALAQDDGLWLPLMANASALVMEAVPHLNWVGFYLAIEAAPGRCELVLGPFQGRVACVRIALGRGVCGTAVIRNQTQRVDDVHAFPGHIACDSASRSEVVVPLHNESGRVVAVLDVDSPLPARFSASDVAGLELVATTVERCCRLGSWEL